MATTLDASLEHRSRGWNVAAIAAFVVVVVAVVGSAATGSSVDSPWFRELDKPSWYPPSSAFGIVWTILYIMIAAAGALAWRSRAGPGAIVAWGGQISLNLAWSVVFFGLRAPSGALAVIGLLILAIVATIASFAVVDRRATPGAVLALGHVRHRAEGVDRGPELNATIASIG